jgi:phage-related protein
MAWGTVELEPEVTRWLEELTNEEFGHVAFYIDLVADRGVHLGEPYTRQLHGKLRELRFYDLRGGRQRVSYYIATGRRIVLLTVFAKQQRQERREVDRAHRAMERCIREGHTAEDDDG